MSTSVSRRSSAPVHPTRQQLEELDALLKRMLELPVNPVGDETDADDGSSTAAPAKIETPAVASPPEALRGPHHPALARPTETEDSPPAAVNYHTPDAEEADLHPRIIPAASEPGEKTIPSTAPPSAKPTEPPQDGAGDWVPLTSSWRPSARTWKPLSDAWRQAQTGAGGLPVPPPWARTEALPPSPAPPPIPQPATRIETPAPVAQPAPSKTAIPEDEESTTGRAVLSPRAVERARHWKPVLPAHARRTHWVLWPLVGFNAVFDACLLPWGPLGRWLRGPTGRAFLGILGLLFLTAAAAWAAAEWIGWTR